MPKPTEPKIDPEELARPTRDPALKAAAIDVTTEAGETGSPLSWRIQPDGTLTVILPSGKKINRPTPALHHTCLICQANHGRCQGAHDLPSKSGASVPEAKPTAKPGDTAKTPTKRKAKKK